MSVGRVVIVLLCALAIRGSAQGTASVVARADSLVGFGALFRAESLYYAAVNARPRDPVARAALGRYLGSRGAHHIAIVLLDEARRFGADGQNIARDLLPLLRATGEFGAIAATSASVVGVDERQRARWLVEHQPSLSMPDSILVILTPGPADRPGVLGIMRIMVNGQVVDAAVDPGATGFTIGTRAAPLRRYGVHAVADSMSIGALRMRNVAMRVDTTMAGVTLGLDELLRFAPGIAPGQSMVLRRSGRLPTDVTGTAIPFRFTGTERLPRFLVGGLWRAFDAPGLLAVRSRMVHIDGRRGRLVVGR